MPRAARASSHSSDRSRWLHCDTTNLRPAATVGLPLRKCAKDTCTEQPMPGMCMLCEQSPLCFLPVCSVQHSVDLCHCETVHGRPVRVSAA